MIYNAFKATNSYGLVEEYFELIFDEKIIPFNTTIVPLAIPIISFISKGGITKAGNISVTVNDLTLTGLHYKAYDLEINEDLKQIGIALHPTALYKITGQDVSKFTNTHILLKTINIDLNNLLLPIFKSDLKQQLAFKTFQKTLQSLPLTINKHTKNIDFAIKHIRNKEGLLNVSDLLKIIHVSQKTLEIKFKEMVGITPGKYIKLYRFHKLMRKFASKSMKIKDLLFMYDYYDESHFSKDFKLFMGESPKNYFKKDYSFLKEYLKE